MQVTIKASNPFTRCVMGLFSQPTKAVFTQIGATMQICSSLLSKIVEIFEAHSDIFC